MNIFAYRADTGFRLPRGTTVMDIVRHEMEVLGNDIGFDTTLTQSCESWYAPQCKWVSFTKGGASRYGKPELVLMHNAIVIGQDYEGGFLVASHCWSYQHKSDERVALLGGISTFLKTGMNRFIKNIVPDLVLLTNQNLTFSQSAITESDIYNLGVIRHE